MIRNPKKLRRVMVSSALLAGVTLGGAGVASAATSTTTTTPSSSASTSTSGAPAETDSSGDATYEVHMKKTDGTYVTVELDSSFKVTGTETGFGPGPAGSKAPTGTPPSGAKPSGNPPTGAAPSGARPTGTPPSPPTSSSTSSAAA